MEIDPVIEGVVKSIISGLHDIFAEYHLDDSEYIRNVKITLDSVEQHLKNKKIEIDTEKLITALYDYAKSLWMENLKRKMETEFISEEEEITQEDDSGYYEYYFDYIYEQGVYPK